MGGSYTYLYGMGRIVHESAIDTTCFLPDALGSVRQLADSSGGILFAQSFDPFGNLLVQTGTAVTLYGFVGEWTDQTELQHLRARYYAPSQGRFLTKDPFPGLLGVPATQHPYMYALNNPILYSDPSGEFVLGTLLAVAIAGGMLGGMSYYAIQTYLDPCVDWNWAEAGLWSGVGGGLGVLTGLAIYGGWWVGTQLGLWGTAKAASSAATVACADGDCSNEVDIVYRVMRPGQHPNSLVEGIWAKNPLANYKPQYHITHGNKVATNWISTTRDLLWARRWQTNNPIYAIDLNKVNSTIVDTMQRGVIDKWHPIAINLATRASEVLVEIYIPSEAIIDVLFK